MRPDVLEKLAEYEDSLYERYAQGSSTFDLILHEYSGFLDCLTHFGLMPIEDWQYRLDTFRDYLKTTERYRWGEYK